MHEGAGAEVGDLCACHRCRSYRWKDDSGESVKGLEPSREAVDREPLQLPEQGRCQTAAWRSESFRSERAVEEGLRGARLAGDLTDIQVRAAFLRTHSAHSRGSRRKR